MSGEEKVLVVDILRTIPRMVVRFLKNDGMLNPRMLQFCRHGYKISDVTIMSSVLKISKS